MHEPIPLTTGALRRVSRRAFLVATKSALLAALGAGCAATRPNRIVLPAKHTLELDQGLVVSDFKIGKDHPLVRDLKQLRRDVSETLELPLGTRGVTVYLFSNELEYNQYLQAAFPGYPPRRAYFIQTASKDLAVYTWWGDRIQEDLRHEFTHGLLHASLEAVPLWLDEGIAEYFEVADSRPVPMNVDHAQALSASLQKGWRPDLERLEHLEKVEHMHRPDYREAWAWVHFMLHGSPDTRQVLLEYIQDLRTDSHPGSLRARLVAQVPDCEGRLLAYVSNMNSLGGWLPAHAAQNAGAVRAANY